MMKVQGWPFADGSVRRGLLEPISTIDQTKIMRIAYLDCFSGISGDMFLAALIDAGVPARLLEDTVAALNTGARLEISRVTRSGITATKVDVLTVGCVGRRTGRHT